MSSLRRDLTDAQWALLDSLIPEPPRRKDSRGRPWRGRREVLDGILFILRTGAAWADLPERYPPYQIESGGPVMPRSKSRATVRSLVSFGSSRYAMPGGRTQASVSRS